MVDGVRIPRTAGVRVALIFCALAVMGSAREAHAVMERSLLRSPEALAMGGAFTALASGRDAPFYNPAGVAANDALSVHYLTLDVIASDWVVTGWKSFEDLKDPTGADLNRLMGENISAQATASAAVLAPHLTIVPFYDVQTALYSKNQAFPKIEYGYQRTGGVQVALGFSSLDGKRRGKGRRNTEFMNEWRFGIGGKYLSRSGGYRLLTATELFTINNLNEESLIGGKGSGYGVDLGVQRIQRLNKTMSAAWGLSYLNIGDIHFGNGASPLKADLSTGVALTFKKGFADLTFAYDIQQLNREADFSKKQNLGLKLGIPLLDVYAGLHQGFLTYGASFDIWLLSVSAYIYKEELGAYPKQDVESRMALRIDLKTGL